MRFSIAGIYFRGFKGLEYFAWIYFHGWWDFNNAAWIFFRDYKMCNVEILRKKQIFAILKQNF